MQGRRQFPSRGADQLPLISQRGGAAAIQIDRLHTAQLEHQFPKLLNGSGAGGDDDQLAVRQLAKGGAGRYCGGKARLLEARLQRGADRAVFNQTGAAADHGGDLLQGEAAGVGIGQSGRQGHRRSHGWHTVPRGRSKVVSKYHDVAVGGDRHSLSRRDSSDIGDNTVRNGRCRAVDFNGYASAKRRGVNHRQVAPLGLAVHLIAGPGVSAAPDIEKYGGPSHIDCSGAGKAEGGQSGNAIQERSVCHNVAHGEFILPGIGGKEIRIDDHIRAGSGHDAAERRGSAQLLVHHGGPDADAGGGGVHRDHIRADGAGGQRVGLCHTLHRVRADIRFRDGRADIPQRGMDIGLLPAADQALCPAFFPCKYAFFRKAFREGGASVRQRRRQGADGQIHQIPAIERVLLLEDAVSAGAGHHADLHGFIQRCGKGEISRAVIVAQCPQQKRDIVLEAQSAVGTEGGGAHAGGIALCERVARIGAGLSGCHIGEGAGAVKGQRGVLLAKHTGQHNDAVQTGGGASQIVAAAGAEEQPQRVEPVGVGLVHGGPRGDAYAQRQDQCQNQRKRANADFAS